MIVIADVHGCFDTLMELMKQFPEGEEVCFVGDLIDRGPKSKEVVEFVKNGGYHCVLGNHEQLMVEGLKEFSMGKYDNMYECWMGNGGDKTAESYAGHNKLMRTHIEWFRTLPLLKTFEFPDHKDLLVTHAPSVDYIDRYFDYQERLRQPLSNLSQIDREALNMEVGSFVDWMIWNRQPPKQGSEKYFGVSGHNVWNTMSFADPLTKCVIFEKTRGFASIDTGVCFPEEPFGILTAIQYPSLKLFQQPLIDDIKKRGE